MSTFTVDSAEDDGDILCSFYGMMLNKEYTDFTIIVEDKSFDVHRMVLAARSPYFAAMFKIPMRESFEKKAVEEDVGKEVFEIVLEYMYTGQIATLGDDVDKLMLCAHRYELNNLTKFCCKSMKRTLTINNAARYLASAHFVEDEGLKKHIVDSVRHKLIESEDWAEVSTNFDLVTYVIEQLSSENIKYAGVLERDAKNASKIRWDLPHADGKFCSPEFEVEFKKRITTWKLQLNLRKVGASRKVDISIRYTGEYAPPTCICNWTFGTNGNGSCEGQKQLTTSSWEHDLQHGLGVVLRYQDPYYHSYKTHKDKHFVTVEFTWKEDKQNEHVFATFFRSKKYFDAKIVVKGETFNAHKLVLSQQSQVFASLFETDLLEYELDDVSPDVFKEMLCLMYMTEGSQTEGSIQLEMLRCAINYRLGSSLIKKCDSNFIDKLNTSNAVTLFIQSHQLMLEKQKSAAKEMIVRKISDITLSEQWNYLKPHHSLVAEILRAVIKLYTKNE